MVNLEITNCTECPFHNVEPDPDPDDWFCDDDMKVRCSKTLNQTPTLMPSGSIMAREPYITVACRPYRIVEECEIPSWCPLRSEL